MSSNFCPTCGAPRRPGVRFCAGCGAALGDGAAGGPGGSAAAPVAPAGGWHVAVGDQLPTFAPVAQPASPGTPAGSAPAASAAPKATGASMRGASWQLLMASGTDLLATYATNDPTALKMATMRAGLTGFTFLAGLIAGRSRGFFSRLAMLSSLILAAVQSTSLVAFGRQIAANPQLLNGLLPNVATQGLALMAAVRTALAARR